MGTPYQGITDRNIFGLKPPPPPVRPEDIKPPTPEIYLTGVTTILGKKQALLKVPAKPPLRPKDESYILTEGQSEGEIQVLNIDEVAGAVKVNNHGSIQTLDFVNNGVKLPAGPAPGAASPQPGVAPMNLPPPPGGPFHQIPPRPLRESAQAAQSTQPGPGGAPNTPGYGGGGANLAFGAVPQSSRLEDSPQFNTGLTGDQQTILIEAQRAKLLDEGRLDEANMYPPTELTPNLSPQ